MIQFSFRTTPVLVDLYKNFKVNRLAKELLQGLTGLGRDLLQSNALMPYNDAFLAVTLHIDDSVDMNPLLVFLESLHADLYTIRNLFVIVEQYLLPDNLRHEKAGRFVRLAQACRGL